MSKSFTLLYAVALLVCPAAMAQDAEPPFVRSMTLEGGPIWSKHIQSGDSDYRERHGLAVAKIETRDYGSWGVYYLSPNSVRHTSVGAGYITKPYTVPVGPTRLELTGALGAVTGYQDYPLPLLVGQARLVVYEGGNFDAGLAMAALPFAMKDDVTGDTDFGLVATSPFLSLRYRFN